jgi:hypothetical protein
MSFYDVREEILTIIMLYIITTLNVHERVKNENCTTNGTATVFVSLSFANLLQLQCSYYVVVKHVFKHVESHIFINSIMTICESLFTAVKNVSLVISGR